MSAYPDINVLPIPNARSQTDKSPKPAHWVDDKGCSFQNPWPSFRKHGLGDHLSIVPTMWTQSPPLPKSENAGIPVRRPTWGLPSTTPSSGQQVDPPAVTNVTASAIADLNGDKIKSTWLGHACFLVEMPARSIQEEDDSHSAHPLIPSRGARILFDPVFSDRCSPSQFMGPKRYTEPPCKIEEIPEVDIIVISHNHYDHLDTHTIRTLSKRSRPPHIFAPLGNGPYFRSLGIPPERVHILDWWDARRVEVNIPTNKVPGGIGDEPGVAKAMFDVTCTPAQHFTGRGLTDRFRTLWAGWVVEEPSSATVSSVESSTRPPVKVYFAGDTGYRAVRNGQDEDTVPVCPAFKEIGARWNGFDFAMIPIGAYKPRDYMSPIHCAPQDSVRLFQDIKAKKALGMHWGAWVLTTEDVLEPPKRLAEERKKVGIEDGDFEVCDIGQTLFF